MLLQISQNGPGSIYQSGQKRADCISALYQKCEDFCKNSTFRGLSLTLAQCNTKICTRTLQGCINVPGKISQDELKISKYPFKTTFLD